MEEKPTTKENKVEDAIPSMVEPKVPQLNYDANEEETFTMRTSLFHIKLHMHL